jgi:uncharacterized protein (TIGR00106 family)
MRWKRGRTTLAEFSINPMNTEHMSKDVARVIETFQATGLEYRLGPMGTCVEADLDQVLAAIRRCHQAVAGNHERVITTIVIDDRKIQPHHLRDMVASVEQQLGHSVART